MKKNVAALPWATNYNGRNLEGPLTSLVVQTQLNFRPSPAQLRGWWTFSPLRR